jgi:pSer/pThr/pTyr-binding forkhead associated (FHA) protein
MEQTTPLAQIARSAEPSFPQLAAAPDDFVPLKLTVKGTEMSVSLSRPEMVFGRHSEADVRLPLPDVSRRHCRFVFADQRWQIFDLNSLNGVLVNGERVQHALLSPHDLVQIGSFFFSVDMPGEESAAHDDLEAERSHDPLRRIAEVLPMPAPAAPPRRQAS